MVERGKPLPPLPFSSIIGAMRPTILAVGLIAVAVTPAARQQASPADQFTVRDVMIPARDGVKLHTKIFAPKNQSGPLPIIMKRTPYGIEGSAGNFNAYFKALADEGYLFVFQ